MEKTKVTEKYQVTIPKKIREKIGLKPGEIVIVEAKSRDEIRLKRFGRVKDPLKILHAAQSYKILDHLPKVETEIKAKGEIFDAYVKRRGKQIWVASGTELMGEFLPAG